MTATMADSTAARVDVSPETVDPPLTRSLVVEKIVSEFNANRGRFSRRCTKAQAGEMIDWLENLLNCARDTRSKLTHPTVADMATRSYTLFDALVPHDALPAEGSAHDLLGRYLLRPANRERRLLHDQTVRGKRTFCNVSICIGR